jgi:hypothetical protein
MKLLFFHRLDLIHLYAPVSKELSKEHEIIHVVFSDVELDTLVNTYGIIGEIYNVATLRAYFYDSVTVDNKELIALDNFIISNTGGRFCLNSSIYLDRTYKNLSYQEANFSAVVYYNIWKYIFETSKPDLFFHEPPALFMTHLAVMFCRNTNAKYLTQIQVPGLNKYQWIFLEGDDASFIEYEMKEKMVVDNVTLDAVQKFINHSNENLTILLADALGAEIKVNKFKGHIFVRGIFGAAFRSIKGLSDKKQRIEPKLHIENFLSKNKKGFVVEVENLYGRLYESYYSEPDLADQYYFYPFHLEPEAVVLYYADGWYEGQIKLIENIAAQLPPNTFLYIKDHPHGGAYRDVRDYKRLLKIRNLKIIASNLSGKQLIKNSLGVITINGTAGFEALLMGKSVFCFGKAFYTNFKGIVNITHVRQLREEIYKSNQSVNENSLNVTDIQMLLEFSHIGFTSYFSNRQNTVGLIAHENITNVAKGIKELINKLNKKSLNLINFE